MPVGIWGLAASPLQGHFSPDRRGEPRDGFPFYGVNEIMCGMENNDDVDPARRDELEPADTKARDHAVARLCAKWQRAHIKRTKQIEELLLKERPKAAADERLVLGLVAHDVALAEILGRTEVQIAERVLALVNDVKVAVALAKTLREVTACRTAASGRVEQLLQTAGVLRGQRQLAEVVPLRRAG